MRIVFDSGPLINLSNTCLLEVLDILPADLYITPTVYEEIYGYPRTKRMYAWSANLINEYIGKRLLVRGLSIRERSEVEYLERVLNSVFRTPRGPIKILHRGELEAVVVASNLDKVLSVDERTLRLIVEDVNALRRRLARKMHSNVSVDRKRLQEARELLRDVFIFRSVDLVAYAYEKGYFNRYKNPKEALRSSLYALKYGGCAVSEGEIESFLRGV